MTLLSFLPGLKRAPDEELMLRVAGAADERAFGELHRRYAGRLLGFFRQMFPGEGDLAADLVQETFFRLYRSRRSYGAGRSFRPWLFTVAYNLGRSELRRRGQAQAYAEEAQYLSGGGACEELPGVRLDAEEFDRALERELALLPPERRVLFSLRFEEEMTVGEVAAALGIPEGTAKSRLYALVHDLREKLKEYEKL